MKGRHLIHHFWYDFMLEAADLSKAADEWLDYRLELPDQSFMARWHQT